MAEKRLYKVRVEFEFAVLASSERDAIRWADTAAGDSDLGRAAKASLLLVGHRFPDGWDRECLVYGAPNGQEITLGDASDAATRGEL